MKTERELAEEFYYGLTDEQKEKLAQILKDMEKENADKCN